MILDWQHAVAVAILLSSNCFHRQSMIQSLCVSSHLVFPSLSALVVVGTSVIAPAPAAAAVAAPGAMSDGSYDSSTDDTVYTASFDRVQFTISTLLFGIPTLVVSVIALYLFSFSAFSLTTFHTYAARWWTKKQFGGATEDFIVVGAAVAGTTAAAAAAAATATTDASGMPGPGPVALTINASGSTGAVVAAGAAGEPVQLTPEETLRLQEIDKQEVRFNAVLVYLLRSAAATWKLL